MEQTAMKLLDKWLTDKWSDPGKLISCLEVSDKIDELLELEKKQIVDAWDNSTAATTSEDTGEEYFINNFN